MAAGSGNEWQVVLIGIANLQEHVKLYGLAGQAAQHYSLATVCWTSASVATWTSADARRAQLSPPARQAGEVGLARNHDGRSGRKPRRELGPHGHVGQA
jgi:hypothetical protein